MNTIASPISKRVFFLLLILAGIVQVACKKNNGGGTPVITDVRAVDSTERDSLFDKALPGTLIVIQGRNLGGLRAVYFNDTATSINLAEATSTNIIVTIPPTAQTAATNPKVPSQIKVVTDHGTAFYSFTLYLPPPTISAISLDSTGTKVVITGSNFWGVTKITFPGNLASPSGTVNGNGNQITAMVPAGANTSDSVRVFCTFGTAAFSYPPPITIGWVTNENAVAGTTITINGTNFVGVTNVLFPGGISGTNLQVVSINQLIVTVPAGITTGDSLRVVGAAGTSASPFVFDNWMSPSVGFQANFDGTNSQWSPPSKAVNPYFGWSQAQWDGTYVTGATNSTGNFVEINPQGAYAPGSNTWYTDNLGVITDSLNPWVSSTSAPIGNYALKFEANVNNWKAGSIWISTSTPSPNWTYMASYAPWKTIPGGVYSTNGWVTVTIPLTSFLTATNNVYTPTGTAATNIPALMNYGEGEIMFMYSNDGTTTIPGGSFVLGIDNVRIVPVK